MGIAMVPEGRRVFPFMSVKDNLMMGAFTRTDKAGIEATLDSVLTRFPRLKERYNQVAGTLSGGEQQMMVIGRALMAKPKLLLLDEPSLGIAPKLVQDIARSIVAINRDEKVSVLLVEQNSRMALRISQPRLRALHRLRRPVGHLEGAPDRRPHQGRLPRRRRLRPPMRLLVVNPNTTASMTGKIGAAARRAASPGTEIVALNPRTGPVSIEGYYDEAISVPGLLDVVRAKPGRRRRRRRLLRRHRPRRCALPDRRPGRRHRRGRLPLRLGPRQQVLASSPRSRARSRRSSTTSSATASPTAAPASAPRDVPVLDLEKGDPDSRAKIAREIRLAIDEDRAEAIVLGCAGMTDLAASFADEFGLPVLDGVACAVAMAEGIARIGLATSKFGGYASPIRKTTA